MKIALYFLVLGKCKEVECKLQQWTQWSATCGKISRKRSIIEEENEVMKLSCDGLQTSCSNHNETEEKETFCKNFFPLFFILKGRVAHKNIFNKSALGRYILLIIQYLQVLQTNVTFLVARSIKSSHYAINEIYFPMT